MICILAACSAGAGSGASERFDTIIENGRIVDGTGNPWYRADVGIRDRKIVAIGNLRSASASTRIDAQDMVVAPGFVDMHSHASYSFLRDPRALSKTSQGITLEIDGEGHSVAPVNERMARRLDTLLAEQGIGVRWRTLGQFFDILEKNPGAVNFASYVGTENVREMVIGFDDRPATAAELEQMRGIVEQAMKDGALGIYSALMYSPDRFNRSNELVEMAKVASRFGGRYQTHPRSESDALESSMREIAAIAREARIPAHITHVKTTYAQNWGRIGEVIDFVRKARQDGLQITADMYPYDRAGGSFVVLLPPWAQEGGHERILERLRDPETRERIKRDLAAPASDWENEYYGTKGGPAGITLIADSGNPKLTNYIGKTVAQIARAEGKDPRDVVLDIILDGDAPYTALITSADDIERIVQEPWVAFGTDGQSVAPDGPLSRQLVHPRAYGTFPRVYSQFVSGKGLVSVEEAVRRASSLPAQILGFRDRGLLREGYFADIVIFDPARMRDRATYQDPHQLSEGVQSVLVNGTIVFANGRSTGARPGMVVRGSGFRA